MTMQSQQGWDLVWNILYYVKVVGWCCQGELFVYMQVLPCEVGIKRRMKRVRGPRDVIY